MIEDMKLFLMDGFKFVLRPVKRTGSGFPSANFRGTGMGLCGFLKDGETFDEFKAKYALRTVNDGEDRD
jgi:hypothetical protein